MALEKRIQSMPFTQGPDQKSDQKLAIKPSQLFNSVFRGGSLNKRWGRTQLPSAIDTGGVQTEGEALFPYADELLRINGNTVYGLSTAASQWVTKPGGNNYSEVTLRPLINVTSGANHMDYAVVNGVGVLAWNSAGMHIAVVDAQTGSFFQTGAGAVTSSTSTSTVPRCCVLGSKVLVLWADFDNADLYSAVIDTTSPETAPTQSQIRTDVYTSAKTFDAIAYNPSFAAVVYPSSGTDLKLIGVDASGAVTASPAVTTVAAITGASGLQAGLLIQRDTQGNLYIVIGDHAAHSTKYIVRDGTFASVLGVTHIVTTGNWSGTTAEFYTGASIEMSANALTLVLANDVEFNVSVFLGTAIINSSAVATAFSELRSSAGMVIQGDAVRYDGTAVFAAVNVDKGNNFITDTSGLQSSAFVLTLGGLVVGRTLTYASSDSSSTTHKRVARGMVSGQTASFPFSSQGRLAYSSTTRADGTSTFIEVTPLNISLVSVESVSAGRLSTLRVGKTEYIGGAYPRIYDGRFIGETGFQLYPDVTAAVVDNGGGGNLSAGTYQWKLLYSFLNSNGELTRGPVSPALSATLLASHSVTLKVASMPLAMRDLLVTGGNTQIELYRTEANGTVFYRTSSVLASPVNIDTYSGMTSGAIPIVDNVSDAGLVGGELLYTEGGILDWEAPPPYSAACVHNGRLIVLPSDDPFSWWPSSQWVPGETVRFSSFTINRVPSDTGPLTGCASLDGKLVLFTTQTAYMVYGDGPDQLGSNPYPPPQRITSVDSGPIAQTPIGETPMGLMYQSQNGIQLLDRGLNSNLIGADVIQFSTGLWTLKSVFLDSNAQQVRFLLDMGRDVPGAMQGTLTTSLGGVSCVYDYYYQQWSVFLNYGGQASCSYQGKYVMVRSDGVCWQEQPGTFLDQGASNSSMVETPWIKLAGIQGYQRLWNAILLGTYGSDFTLTWDVAYSYSTTAPAVPVYESGNTVTLVGNGEFSVGGEFQVRHNLGTKCQSVKFRFTDSSITGSGAGMALSDLSLEYGVRKGVFKLPAAQTA